MDASLPKGHKGCAQLHKAKKLFSRKVLGGGSSDGYGIKVPNA